MKTKFLVVAVILAATCFSCCNKRCNAKIETRCDSVNYMFGVVNGEGIRQYVLQGDTLDSKKVDAFCDGFRDAFGLTDGEEYVKMTGVRVGASLGKEIGSGRLFNDSTIPVKEKLITEAFEKTVRGEKCDFTGEEAMAYVQKVMGASMFTGQACSPAPQQVDSLNICVGILNASQARGYFLGKDTTDKDIKHFMSGFKKGLKFKTDSVSQMRLTGMNVAAQFTQQFRTVTDTNSRGEKCLFGDTTFVLNFDAIGRGVIEAVRHDSKQIMGAQEAQEYLRNVLQEIQDRKYAPVKKANEEFLVENAKNDSVKTTASGLQYKVLVEGKGAQPTDSSTVKVHYTGRLIDGTVFDSSIERGEPLTFELSRVILGWQEGLKLMHVGSKYMLYIPQELGYGERGGGEKIPPYATLIFEVELLSIEK